MICLSDGGEQMSIEEYIPFGRENAVTRQVLCALTGLSDRGRAASSATIRTALGTTRLPIWTKSKASTASSGAGRCPYSPSKST